MAWCRLEDTFFDDPKFNRLSGMLGIHFHHAKGLVASLWSWAVRVAPDGDLRQYEPSEIEGAVRWDGESGVLVSALLAVQLLDEAESGLVLHRFFERAESHKAAQRQRKHREKHPPRNVTVTFRDNVQGQRSGTTFRDNVQGQRLEEREEREEILRENFTDQDLQRAEQRKNARPAKAPDSRGCVAELEGKSGSELLADDKHELQRAWIAEYKLDFVAAQLSAARLWLLANPDRRPKKFGRFFTSWLARSHERARKLVPTKPAHVSTPGKGYMGGAGYVPTVEETAKRYAERENEWKS